MAITLPLRIVQASATAAAEQLCAAPMRASAGSRSKFATAPASNNAPDQLLGAAIAVHLRRVDQCDPERQTCAQRFFLSGFRMFTLPETRRALAERRDDGSIV